MKLIIMLLKELILTFLKPIVLIIISIHFAFALILAIKAKGIARITAVFLSILLLVFGSIFVISFKNEDILPIEERSVMLMEYYPFEKNTKAILLNEESTMKLSYEEAASIRIDGATALYPVYASFARNIFEPTDEYYMPGEDKSKTLLCTGTGEAFKSLMNGEADLIFCAAPSQKQIEAAAELGIEFHLHEIGREAFVFFVNSKNKVEGLTVEEIRNIYSGEITNWKEVGGKNTKIKPFQRDEGSGSQTAMISFMRNKKLMEPQKEEIVGGMLDIIEKTADYRNHIGAIGYTFRYYANEMIGNNRIRLLKLNGIEPTKETIRSGEYPITDCFYAITASKIGEPAPEESNETLKEVLDWIKSEQGQKIIEEVGYVSLH